ncbi:MAG: SDR family oxidoreductase [Gammaproteobacteria bacterium]|jgi:meso-butanediol dehydrogenase/(S,S)-butanediol dehydrogenase/diacetyl reductase|nr:SDR family oxidoreductase [Gammaproteobacteria bacterium]MCP4881266.1 SDR family oxidoreductase [Gammaproteobacteria bacterium]MDP6164997.1 SDR family oxidoreductase [Gammaproteobacteria bacterium]
MKKVVLVTGGGRGIGLGISQAFLQAGYQVLVVQRSPLPDELRQPDVDYRAQDLGHSQSFDDLLAFVEQRYGRLDVLVNNAGMMLEQSMGQLQKSDWDAMLALNVTTPVFLSQTLQPLLQASQGAIVNIGSIEGLASNPHHVAYCATKGAVHSMTQAMAVDLGHYGIRCNAIAPGWIKSDLSDAYINAQEDVKGAWQGLDQMHPVGHVGEPLDVGQAAVFLAGQEAKFITGQVLVVDGGRTAKLPLPF